MKNAHKIILSALLIIVSAAAYADTFGDCINQCTSEEADCISACADKPDNQQIQCQNNCSVRRNQCDARCQSLSSLMKENDIGKDKNGLALITKSVNQLDIAGRLQ